MDHADADFFVGKLFEACLDCLGRALHIGLDDQVQLLHLALLHLGKEVIERDLACTLCSSVLFRLLSLLHKLTRHTLIGNGIEFIAGSRRFGKSGDLHGDGRACFGNGASLIIRHDADTADCRTGNDQVALMQRAVLHKQCRNRAAILIQTSLNDRTLCSTVGICLQLLQLRSHNDRFQKGIDAFAGFCGNAANLGVAAPLGRNEFMLGKLGEDTVGVGARLIHLIDRNNNGNLCGFGMVDCFDGLRHDTVIGSNHQNCNIGAHCATRTHGGECGVTRCV